MTIIASLDSNVDDVIILEVQRWWIFGCFHVKAASSVLLSWSKLMAPVGHQVHMHPPLLSESKNSAETLFVSL